MKDTTFGNSPAAITLSKILTQLGHKKLRANVTSYWSGYCHGVRGIMSMPDKKLALSLLILWKDSAVTRARGRFYGEVATYVVNITVAKFRESMELL